ncbi:conserved hypothetical protein [Xanthomonas phaseoli pv. phaseoli]|uniref:Uncharacterized protein n=1 Tax=Xanthomonas campestris pv. phaseoli TaxID=317013 RepID=A0AB38DWI5_XANCH|nr:conserved hypothetical protein [Xanthomonas phaseoli pv. phaseoli]SON83454.1 conserved hypothetical protein [Xanthomonas phaseoli pv. phaseoli]
MWICLRSLASADRGSEGGGLCPPPASQADALLTTDDQVVKDPDVQEAEGFLQALGDLAVCFAGLRVPARVVVEEDEGDGVEPQGTFGDDPGMDFAAVDGASEQMLGGQDVVLGVEEDDAEDFVRQVGAAGDQVAAGLVGAVDSALALKALLQDGRGGEQDALLVHLELVLSLQVLGALHRFFSTSALCASWEPTGEASGPTAPRSEHRGSGAQRRAATERQRREGGLALRIGAAKLRSLSEAQRWWIQPHAAPQGFRTKRHSNGRGRLMSSGDA